MTKEELLRQLEECQRRSEDDEERAHYNADIALLHYIADDTIKIAFLKVKRWYA